jgi:hypothetical protein
MYLTYYLRFLILKVAFPAIFLLWISGIQSCDHESATVPAFIRIDTLLLDSTYYDSTGTVVHRIQFAWVYADDNLQGVYRLPVVFPILKEGDVALEVYAGVSENGISTMASRYPFFSSWKQTIKLNPTDTEFIEPRVRYKKGFQVPVLEDFEQAGSRFEFAQGGGFYTHDQSGQFSEEGLGAGVMYLPQGAEELIIQSIPFEIPPKLPGYFLEISYRNNAQFIVGIRSANSSDSRFLVGVRVRETWNKLYINLTDAVDELGAVSQNFRIFIRMPQDSTVEDQLVYLDNIKILY